MARDSQPLSGGTASISTPEASTATAICANCARAYDGELPVDADREPAAWRRFIGWRREAISVQMAAYYNVMRGGEPAVLLHGPSYGGAERPDSVLSRRLSSALGWVQHASFSQLLFTSAELRTARDSRLWVGLSADQAAAAGGRPLINIKMEMRDLRLSQTFMPPDEFTRLRLPGARPWGWAQAGGRWRYRNGCSMPARCRGRATSFAFMKQQEEVFDSPGAARLDRPGVAGRGPCSKAQPWPAKNAEAFAPGGARASIRA